jgi:hypothetical protein
MTPDNTRNTPTDVGFKPAGSGHYSARRCDAKRGAFLCGKPARLRNAHRAYCAECAGRMAGEV